MCLNVVVYHAIPTIFLKIVPRGRLHLNRTTTLPMVSMAMATTALPRPTRSYHRGSSWFEQVSALSWSWCLGRCRL